jgi:hypothetical protein
MRKWLALLLIALGGSPVLATEPDAVVFDWASLLAYSDARDQRWVVDADYVVSWLREGRLPPTLTTSTAASQGLLGQPDTRILYGDDRLETRHGDRFNGVRLTLGWWCDDAETFGLEASGFILERDSTYFKATSDGSVLLTRPYINPDGTPGSAIIAGLTPAGVRNGGFVGYSRLEFFGEEANAVAALVRDDNLRVDFLGGARFLQMRDRTDLTATGWLLPAQTTLYGLTDFYRVHNAYYGAQVGLRGEWTYGRWSLNMRGDVGLGANVEQVIAYGQQIVQTPTSRIVTPFGLTVKASNTGTFDRTAVNLVTGVSCTMKYRLTQHIQASAGYSFLLWDGPLRSGDQVELGPTPTIPFRRDVFWAQGLHAGLEFAW